MTHIRYRTSASTVSLAFLLALWTLAVAPSHAQDPPPVPTPSYPVDGLIVPTNAPELNWWVGAPLGSMTFDVQVEISASAEAVCDQPGWPSGIAGTQQATTGCDPALVPGETYRWRVRSVDGGVASDWSAWAEFTTDGNGLAVASTPSYPVGDLLIHTTAPQLHWYTEQNNTGITFTAHYLKRDGGAPASCAALAAAAGSVSASPALGVAHVGVVVEPGATYDWCVNASGLNGDFDSAVASFLTAGPGRATTAVPSYPMGGLEIYTTSPQFHWYTGENNTGVEFTAYYLKVDAGAPADCAAIRADGDTQSVESDPGVTRVGVENLEPGATYYWCVRSSGPNGEFDSVMANFSVAGGGTLSPPVASWPVGNPIVYQTSQTLHWYVEGSSVDLTGYEVEYCVAPDAFGDAGCTTVAGIGDSQLALVGLNLGDVVTWRVRATYAAGPSSDWTNPNSQGSFTVYGGLATLTAVPTYPADDLLVYDTDITFSWYVTGAVGAADRFKVQYSQDNAFPAVGTEEIETGDSWVLVSGLTAGAAYWWRIAVSNDGGATYGGWSDVASFSVNAGANAPMPRIGGPTNGIGLSTTSPTLSWITPSPSTSDIVYDVRYAKDGVFGDGNDVEITGLATPFVNVEGLEEGSYHWQVRSRTADGASTSAYSERGTFTTSSRFGVGIEERLDIPLLFELDQNYPNPFNPSTTIEYRMAETASATIKVYNVLGQVVKTLVDGVVPAGVHQVTWDATDNTGAAVATGVYLYRMDVGGSSETRALVLMK